MFWVVSADCSPLLPVSGLAIVAGAEWMCTEPEMILKTPLLAIRGWSVFTVDRTNIYGRNAAWADWHITTEAST